MLDLEVMFVGKSEFAKLTNLSVEQPTTFQLYNLTTSPHENTIRNTRYR